MLRKIYAVHSIFLYAILRRNKKMQLCKDCYVPMIPVMSFSSEKHEKFCRCPKCYSETRHQKIKDSDLCFGEELHKEINKLK